MYVFLPAVVFFQNSCLIVMLIFFNHFLIKCAKRVISSVNRLIFILTFLDLTLFSTIEKKKGKMYLKIIFFFMIKENFSRFNL